MKIYLVSIDSCDYDEYDAFVVVANTVDEARSICFNTSNQAAFKEADVTYLGESISEAGPHVVLGSFNAG